MSENALPKGYEPHAVEDHWREYWEKNKTFFSKEKKQVFSSLSY